MSLISNIIRNLFPKVSKGPVIDKIKDELYTDIRDHLNEKRISAFIYGKGAEDDYTPENGPVSAAVVLESSDVKTIDQLRPVKKKWQKRGVMLHYFFTENFIETSLDVFPIEYFNMKNANIHLGGKKIFENVIINKNFLRTQCERELRGLLLHMRSRYTEIKLTPKALDRFFLSCLDTFRTLFKSLIYLKQDSIPGRLEKIVDEVEDLYQTKGRIKSLLLNTRRGFNASELKETPEQNLKDSGNETPENRSLSRQVEVRREAFKDFIAAVEQITYTVDQMNL